MFEHIRADTMRVHRKENAFNLPYSLWINYGLRALVIYRFGHWLGRMQKQTLGWLIAWLFYPVYWLLSAFVRKAYGINLAQNAEIAPGFYINHFGGIEVKNCRIGSCCNIQQQVKLGSDGGSNGGLVIGEGVYIGAHARIYADINIGDGATIGAGAVVTQDIPAHCLVLGNPGRIVQRDYDNSAFL
ncbi:MAG: serine O-acetyltransferase [Methylobacter sp.]